MRSFVHIVNSISDWSGKVIVIMPWFMGFIITWEIFMRYVFDKPTFWAHEVSLQLFGAFSLLCGAYALRYLAHVNVDLFYARWSPRVKAIVNMATFFVFLLFIGMLLWQGWGFAWRATAIRQYSQSPWGPPVYPLKWTIVIGSALLLLQGAGMFVSNLLTAITGKGVEE